jgi:hypothetical protein
MNWIELMSDPTIVDIRSNVDVYSQQDLRDWCVAHCQGQWNVTEENAMLWPQTIDLLSEHVIKASLREDVLFDCDRFPHGFELDCPEFFYEFLKSEKGVELDKNCPYGALTRNYYGYFFIFADPRDATMFKLVWGGK